MGCHCAKELKVAHEEQEEAIVMHERALGFYSLPAAAIAMELRVFAPEGHLKAHQLKEVLMALGLPYAALEAQGSPLSGFFQQFREGKQYAVRKLGLLGVLLGSGSLAQKTEVVYSLCDEHFAAELTTSQMTGVLVDLLTIACVFVPHYAELEMQAVKDQERLSKHRKYTSWLRRRLNKACSLLLQRVLQGQTSVTKTVFLSQVTEHCSYLLDTHLLRFFLSSIAEEELRAEHESLFVPQDSAAS